MAKSKDKFRGMFIGLAVGDALGTTLEFKPLRPLHNLHTEMTGGGCFRLEPGEWTDDTAMAVAMARSLVHEKALRPLSVLREWSEWYEHGKHSCTGTCFDIGGATRGALSSFLNNPTEVPNISPHSLGNGTLMRLAPIVLFAANAEEAESLAYEQSLLTHAEDAAKATAWFADLLFRIAATGFDPAMLPAGIGNKDRRLVSASGFYRDTLDAALWAVASTTTFEDALIQAVNLGDDSDTVGAVTGQLAGAIYGESAIPHRWLEHLAWRDELSRLADALLDLAR